MSLGYPQGDNSGPNSWGHVPSAKPPRVPVPLTRGWHRLGSAVRVLIGLSVVVSVAQVFLYAWGLGMFDDAIATGDIARLDRYDDLDAAADLTALGLLVVAGVCWMVWQYKLAASTAPEETRRTPGWHAGSWVIPFANLWLPYQNVTDLWRRRFGATGALLPWWWAAYLGTTILGRFYARMYGNAENIEDLKSAINVGIASAVLGVVGGLLAIRVNRRLCDAELVALAGPGPNRAA